MRILKVSLFFLISIILSGAQNAESQQAWEALAQKLYPAAQKEGQLIAYSTNGNLAIGGDKGVAQFNKRFPGIKFNILTLGRPETFSRIVTESRAGKVTMDATWDDPIPAKKLIDRGLVEKLNPNEITDQPQKFKFLFEPKVPVVGHSTNFFVYNTKLVAKSTAPRSYEALLDPKWKGKISMDARGPYGFSHLSLVWGEEKFWKFIKAFPSQNPIWATRCTDSTDKVVVGEAYIGCGSPRVDELIDQKAPIDYLALNPILARTLVFIPLKNSPHPNTTKLLIAWLYSPEGISAVGRTGYGLAIAGSPIYDRVKRLGGEFYYTDDLSFEQLDSMLKTREEIGNVWGVMK